MIHFFFQAADGIRDDLVTGVQTCALPISVISTLHLHSDRRDPDRGHPETLDVVRSEERRVGKECRYRWSPYLEKKNLWMRDHFVEHILSDQNIKSDVVS